MSQYTHPETLVDTAWVAEHADDPNVRIVESDEDVLLYDRGHIAGAIALPQGMLLAPGMCPPRSAPSCG